MKAGKVVKPPVASRAAVNKKLGLTQSRQAGSCTERVVVANAEREALIGREEEEMEEELKVERRQESDHKSSAKVTNILGNRSRGEEEVPTNVRGGRKLCISGGGGGGGGGGKGEGEGDLRNEGAEAVQGGEAADQPDQHLDVQSGSRNGERRKEEGGRDGTRGELGTGLSTLERVSKVSRNRTTVTYWSEQFL